MSREKYILEVKGTGHHLSKLSNILDLKLMCTSLIPECASSSALLSIPLWLGLGTVKQSL